MKNIVELAFEVLLHHGLVRLLLPHLVLDVVLELLYAHSLYQRQICQLAHSVVKLFSQKVVLTLIGQPLIQFEIIVVTITAHICREHACN